MPGERVTIRARPLGYVTGLISRVFAYGLR
jgi:hypothetical protein